MRMSFKAKLFASVAVMGLAAAPAFAQDEEDTIIVTATKREQSIQDVPFSVNAQTQEDIQRTGSQNLEDISRNVAGLAIQNLGPGQSQVGIRGVSAGQIVRDQPGVKEQVGVYLDESVVSLSLFTPDLELFDLNRVETLRGPQGTLYGSGNIGGTIRYITNQPKLGEFEGLLEANINHIQEGGTGGHVKGMVNLPLADNAAARIVAFVTRYPGFIDALTDAGVKNDVNGGERHGFRVALRWEPTENIVLTPRFTYQDINVDGFNRQEIFNLYANPFTTTRPAVNFQERRQFLLLDEAFEDRFIMTDLNAEIDLGAVTFTSVTSYQARDILVSRDASALTHSVSLDLAFDPSILLTPSNLRDTTQLKTFTQEARLASNYESALQWIVGVFYTDVERNYAQRLPTPGYDAVTDLRFGAGTAAAVDNGFGLVDQPYHADVPYDIEQFAVFGEATLAITDRLDATAGVRYYDFSEDRVFHSGGLFSNGDNRTDSTSSDGFSPRFLLSYDLTDEVTVNAQASKGFRLGGVNDPLNLPICSGGAGGPDALTFGGFPTYEDETLWNYEGGVKISSGRVTFNAAGFYTDIKNLQISADAGSCSSRVVFNVPSAHSLGLEAELSAELVEGFEIGIAGSWLNAEFDSTRLNTATAAPDDVIAGIRDGNRLASVPKLQIAANAQYTFALGGDAEGFIAGSIQHVGSRFTQAGDQEGNPVTFVSGLAFGGASGANATVVDLELPSYQIVNLSAGITFGATDLIFYVNNATDENALLAFDRERGGRARLGFHTNQPRTFGVTARVRF